jgi:hypothetical protein
MTIHTIIRDVDVTTGSGRWATAVSTVEVRYTFTVTPGRKAVTWANAAGGFSPEEGPSVDLQEVAVRWHKSQEFTPVDGWAWDILCADLTDAWFLNEIDEEVA